MTLEQAIARFAETDNFDELIVFVASEWTPPAEEPPDERGALSWQGETDPNEWAHVMAARASGLLTSEQGDELAVVQRWVHV